MNGNFEEKSMKKIGLFINPIAGMGGKVGLKGTDGQDTLALARQRGAKPESSAKAIKALRKLLPLKDELLFFVASGSMGEMAAEKVGLNYKVIYEANAETTQKDTLNFLKKIKLEDVELLLFAGGDGTAKDVAQVIGLSLPVIGIPTGVKIHSPVYAITPEDAGALACDYLNEVPFTFMEKEVIDLDEEAFRKDEIKTQIFGFLKVPEDKKHLQAVKSPTPQSDTAAQVSAALQVIDEMEEDVYYLVGSGSTTSKILEELDLPVTQLGVDIFKNGELIAKDVYEQQILEIIDDNQ